MNDEEKFTVRFSAGADSVELSLPSGTDWYHIVIRGEDGKVKADVKKLKTEKR